MKLLVMSDSHRNIDHMRQAVEKTGPDAVLHLGDHLSDAQALSQLLPDLSFYMVRGNCDFYGAGEDDLLLTLRSARVFMTHGHAYGVKRGIDAFIKHARALGVDVALYGHTHRALVRREYGLWIMCPGQMERNGKNSPASYGIVTIENGNVNCEIGALDI